MIDYDPYRWTSHLLDVKGSMVREILGRVSFCAIWAVAVVTVEKTIGGMNFSSTTHTLVGVALGLLLVFRTNASYDRFWEGRKMWGAIINESRNLGRGAKAYLAPAAPDIAEQVALWTVAFPRAAMHYLRDGSGLGPAAERLPAGEADAALAAPNVPVHVATRLTERLVEARDRGVISDFILTTLDQ